MDREWHGPCWHFSVHYGMVACMPPTLEQSTPAHELAALVGPAAELGAPRYATLARRIRDLVSAGQLPPGTRLPAERDLATALATSRVTVASAYRVLREEGWARTRHGSGTVTDSHRDAAPDPWFSSSGTARLDLAHAAPAAAPELEAAYRAALEQFPALTAGHGYFHDGLPELRAAVADRFTARGLPTEPDQVVVTAGVGDASAVVAEALLQPGDRVLVEHPTYPGVLRVVEGAGGRLVPVAIDATRPDDFVQAAHLAARQSAPRLAYLEPDFANPTGARLSAAGRRRLAATLWQQGVVTVVDEVTAELHLDEQGSLPPYAAGVPDAATVTLGGLSKAVWGGLRIGWLRTDAALAARLNATLSRRQLGVGVLDQLAATLLVRDLDAVLADRRRQLRTQRDALLADLAALLPDWRVHPPAGGLSLWCALPAGLSSAALTSAAARSGLVLAEGRAFGTGYSFDDHLRLPFTLPPAELRSAVELLAALAGPLTGADRAGPATVAAVV